MMAANSSVRGGWCSHASRENRLAAFDRLPRSVRAALANAAFDWAAYPLWRRFERGDYTAKVLVKLIGIWDARQIAKDKARIWGIAPEKRTSKKRGTAR